MFQKLTIGLKILFSSQTLTEFHYLKGEVENLFRPEQQKRPRLKVEVGLEVEMNHSLLIFHYYS